MLAVAIKPLAPGLIAMGAVACSVMLWTRPARAEVATKLVPPGQRAVLDAAARSAPRSHPAVAANAT